MADDHKNGESFPAKEDHKREGKEDHMEDDAARPAPTFYMFLMENKNFSLAFLDFLSKTFLKILARAFGGRHHPLNPVEDAAPPAKDDSDKDDAEEDAVPQPQAHRIENIVLVGRTGNGKSATGNSIAGKKVFVSKAHATGVTHTCQTFKAVTPEGPILNVIDTPGLFDLSASAEFIGKEIVRCLSLAEGGLHAVLLVLSTRTEFPKEEEMVLRTLQVLFGSKIVEYLVVVFSAGDKLEDDGVTLDEYLYVNCPEFFQRILSMCGRRKILFNNKTEDEAKKTKQVHELLKLIDQEEKDRHKKKQEELESKGHAEEQLEAFMKELQLTNQQNLKAIEDMTAKNIKMALNAQEKLFEQREKAQGQRLDEKMKMRYEMNKQIPDEECNIL